MSSIRNASQPHACTLTELQQAFQLALLEKQDEPPPFIVNAPKASAAERFGVYMEAYRLRLVEALTADYPAVNEWLGDETFDRLGRAYADACPSAHFSIRWFGSRLPSFLAETAPYDSQPHLQELAAFEWALSEAFDAAEGSAATQEPLAALEPMLWPMLKLRLHPSLRCIDLSYNTPGRWQALNRKEPPPDLETRLERQPWVVWRRRDLKIFFRSMPKTEAWSLNAFRQERCFADVCEGLCEWLDEEQVAVTAAGYLQSWLSEGWVVGIGTE
jgi:Putative DNA-binding domain